MDYTLGIVLFIIGTIFGSFTNVIIYRIPLKISLLQPPSTCPECGHRLSWYENVPLISYLLLRGKCQACSKHISVSYALIELLMGLLFIFIYPYTQNIYHFIYFSFLIIMFISIGIIDYKHFIIPDKLIVTTAIVSILYYSYSQEFRILDNFLSAAILFVSLYLLRIVSFKMFKKESLGMGDVKLGALIGFLMGWKAALLAIFFGFNLAAIVLSGLFIFRVINRNSYIPFGPFMLGGMFVYLFWGSWIINWYIHLAFPH